MKWGAALFFVVVRYMFITLKDVTHLGAVVKERNSLSQISRKLGTIFRKRHRIDSARYLIKQMQVLILVWKIIIISHVSCDNQ